MKIADESQHKEGAGGEQLCCPACGSVFICSSKSSGGAVFHVHGRCLREVTIVRESRSDGETIDHNAIFCGACSWHGRLDELVVSLMQ